MPDRTPQPSQPDQKKPGPRRGRRPLSMHENVPIWHDCCACEAEPRWRELEQELQRTAKPDSPDDASN